MEGVVFDPCALMQCARWLGLTFKTSATCAQILQLVVSKLPIPASDEEGVTSDGKSDSVSDGMSEEEREEDVSVNPGLSLFEDPSPVNLLYEGPANFPLKPYTSTNPFISGGRQVNTINPTLFNQSPGGEEYKLILKWIELLKLEHEESERVRKHELEIIRLKCELARCQAGSYQVSFPNVLSQDKFDIGAALMLVPIFEASDVPEFFKAFERVTTRLVWPRELWTVLIQCRLVGKAIRVYNALKEGIAQDYTKVKSLVLQAYDLVHEAYRLKFRTVNKPPSMTFVEYARLKEEQFYDWVKSRHDGTFSSLKELMCLEEFKKVCGGELKLHIEEVKAVNLATAAQIAEISAPLIRVEVSFPEYSGRIELAVLDSLPVPWIDSILGNDVGKDTRGHEVSITAGPVTVTPRAAAKKAAEVDLDSDINCSSLEVEINGPRLVACRKSLEFFKMLKPDCDRKSFIQAQKDEFDFEHGGTEELSKHRFVVYEGLLYRLGRPFTRPALSASGNKQTVVPTKYRETVLSLAHEDPFAGHIGIGKTFQKVAKRFWWLGMKSSVKKYVPICETCQVMVKPNQGVPRAPLHIIPSLGEPFSELVVDVVGPLPRTKTGFVYVLTIMDSPTRYPEAIPKRKITSRAIFDKLIDFFSRFGLPCKLQSDCGSNFTSKIFRSKSAELAIQHLTSVPYHPESQGMVERFHQTLKSMLKKKYYFVQGEEWDKGLPCALFAIRNLPNSPTGVAPFDLVFGHKIRGPLEIFHEFLESREVIDQSVNEVLDNLRSKLSVAWQFAKENLASAQGKMKAKYDKKCKVRSFEPGDLVLVLGTGLGNFLEPRFEGPWRILRKLSEVNYEIEAPSTRRKCRVFHINRLKSYSYGSVEPKRVPLESVATILDYVDYFEEDELCPVSADALNTNFQSLELLESGLKHLEAPQRENILNLIMLFPNSWQDSPGRTSPLEHDVDIGDALPVKQSPYRLNPEKRAFVEKEIIYMLEHDFFQLSISPWSSPVVLVKKPDGEFRMCVDYRKVNIHTKSDSFPLPRIDDCLDQIGPSKFITKLYLLKRY
ncbi:uncharacterized protein [Palaemon carinicauda]|uniref:uncharacterized protein n=1 Tax=Palaemon carinicauda TaxID=392227 RepID=UPI0035B61B9A